MNVEDLNEYVNEDSVKGKLTRELLEILADFKNGIIDIKIFHEISKELYILIKLDSFKRFIDSKEFLQYRAIAMRKYSWKTIDVNQGKFPVGKI